MKQCEKQCEFKGCNNRAHSRGLCGAHYMRWKRYGDPYYKPAPKTVASSDSNRALLLDCEKNLASARHAYDFAVGLDARVRWKKRIKALEAVVQTLRENTCIHA